LLKGRVTKLEIGVSAGDHSDITNLAYARWNRVHEITPGTVSGTKVPNHWNQGHSWMVFEIGVRGYNTALTTAHIDVSDNVAYDEDGDSFIIDYFVFSYETATQSGSPTVKTTTFVGAIIATQELDLHDTNDPITIVRGLAYYKTDG
jgi:hypothetical protein